MTQTEPTAVLIAYDGSEPARQAIEHAGRLFPGRPALGCNGVDIDSGRGGGRARSPAQALIDEAVRNLDSAAQQDAAQTADDGAERARAAGLNASPLVLRRDPSTWASIVRLAHQRQVLAVVVGSRGRSAIKSAVLGSVSNAVVHNCRRPVVVHPQEEGDADD